MSASKNGTKLAISPEQCRAARALLNLSQDQLVALSGVPKRTVVRFEAAETQPQRRTVEAICSALEGAGIEFIAENGGGAGVRLRKDTGQKGL
ncbi:helix-turn-helix domain-containing protein [Acidiphilium multivorum]|jgi:transcriptional regulator with XRE-family HTH domain|uniref:helix-turn-helix domain-containing protein n=1 Tax=Acidiphilium multivorum TaxID=62140 RepID=UPI001B8CA7CE|nr:helix-turn-helix transcriptional regulator [Acidiphilium multivorum]MBS3024479.1 helix-turn-helix transcriptional regulator [Acidiphilium multivorum]